MAPAIIRTVRSRGAPVNGGGPCCEATTAQPPPPGKRPWLMAAMVHGVDVDSLGAEEYLEFRQNPPKRTMPPDPDPADQRSAALRRRDIRQRLAQERAPLMDLAAAAAPAARAADPQVVNDAVAKVVSLFDDDTVPASATSENSECSECNVRNAFGCERASDVPIA